MVSFNKSEIVKWGVKSLCKHDVRKFQFKHLT